MGAEAEEKSPPATAAAAAAAGDARPGVQIISQAQFLSWKQRKDAEEAARRAEAARKRTADISAGTAQMNGREVFEHEPWVFDNNLY